MIQMVSLLERSGSNAGGAQDVPAKKEMFFSELMEIVEGSTAEDTVDTLKQKMEKSIEMYEQKLSEASAIASEYEYRKKVKIAVHLFDENDMRIPTVPWLEEGFRFQPLSSALKGSRLKVSQTGFFVGVPCCLFFITTSEDPIESTTRTCSSFTTTNLRSGKC